MMEFKAVYIHWAFILLYDSCITYHVHPALVHTKDKKKIKKYFWHNLKRNLIIGG